MTLVDTPTTTGPIADGSLHSHFQRRQDAILIVDDGGRITFANTSAGRIFGRPPDELLGTSFGIPQVSGERTVLDISNRRGGRRQVSMQVEVFPWSDEPSLLISLSDVTRPRRSQVRLRQLRTEVRRLERDREQFVAMMAHELRNPLAPLMNAATLLRQPIGPAEDRWARETVERQAERMSRIVEDLMALSTAGLDRMRLRREPRSVGSLVIAAVEATRPQFAQHKHCLATDFDGQDPWIDADPVWFEQALIHLLVNAAKYTDDGGRIVVSIIRLGASVRIEVRDDGMGLDAEQLDRIFLPYRQEPDAQGRSKGGMGIGLPLVRRVIDLHGGRVWAESAGRGRGSTFLVEVPLAPTFAAAPPLPTARPAAVPAEAKGLRVLIVDDNRVAADSLGMLLKHWGHEPVAVYGGLDAVESARSFRPHVALIDLELPDVDGYEVARHLGGRAEDDEPLLVALSGYGPRQARAEAAHLFDLHMPKPVDSRVLQPLLAERSALQRRRREVRDPGVLCPALEF